MEYKSMLILRWSGFGRECVDWGGYWHSLKINALQVWHVLLSRCL